MSERTESPDRDKTQDREKDQDRAVILARAMEAAGLAGADVAVVLGSGLGDFADGLTDTHVVPYEELEGMPGSTVAGHAGRFVRGRIGDATIVCQQGRVHLYEGGRAEEVTRAVRALALTGCGSIVLTNAAGGMNPDWEIPTLMRITDHLNLTGRTPLRGDQRGFGTPYDVDLGAIVEAAAAEVGVDLKSGVYAGLLGPSYETAAEIRMLTAMGAHAVGMSTVLEAIAAHAHGMRVAAISCISNPAAGISATPLNHAEVLEAGKAMAAGFTRLLETALPRMAGPTAG